MVEPENGWATAEHCERKFLNRETFKLEKCGRKAIGFGKDQNDVEMNLCKECIEDVRGLNKAREVNDCGHPKKSMVKIKGKEFCADCEAESREPLCFGIDCILCHEEIEGTHYECATEGGTVCYKCHERKPPHVCICVMDELPTKGLAYQYDQDTDVLTVEGLKYAGALFREFGVAPIGTTLRIVERKDGVVTVQRVEEKK